MNRDQIAEVIYNLVFPDLFGRLPWSAVKNENARAPILAAADAIMALDGWQTIDSAPRDGRSILAAGGGLGDAVDVVSYSPSVGCWNCSAVTLDDVDDEPEGYSRPTHWRPLPQPPGDAG